ncbi:MAG: AraC family transcriptional regulator [Hydrocarboniphaga sp.]|uniref:helix-turn-helix domain-containing protein n=1 Tax=Hydrocarboniphaga sp. TaxID=2033016 RepID=UPI002634AEB0|nr:helix-turn-helix domain-containing protein [Hydrocarboniphaga sp.]MDB5968371.1 AraC family transcriptional regulator [Hydrocarboniphaga sp.]
MTSDIHSMGSPAEPPHFTAVIRNELCAMQYQSDVCARSRPPSLAGLQVGPVDVLRYSGLGEQWGARDQRHIRMNRVDYYVVCAPVAAQLGICQNGSDIQLRAGTCTLLSTNRPFSARIRSEVPGKFFSAMHVRVSGSLLRRQIPNLDDACGREIPLLPGSGRMMISMFDVALNDGPFLSPAERERLGANLLELIGGVATGLADSCVPDSPGPHAHQRTLDRAMAFIASHLSDPQLDPARVAEHCRVSTRYLHASFAALSPVSVASLIREHRLQASREMLMSPRVQHRTIIEIAGDWGFEDPAHFCRVYKARYGRSPREDRFRDAAAAA